MDTEAKDTTDAVLSGIAPATEVETFDTVSTQDILSALDHVADVPDADNLDDILSSLETAAPDAPVADDIDDVLSGIAPTPEAEVDDDTLDILAGLPETMGHQPDAPTSDDILAVIDTADVADPAPAMDDLDDLLADLGSSTAETSTDGDETASTQPETDDLDALFAELNETSDVGTEAEMPEVLDDPLVDIETPAPEQPDTEATAGLDDLDDLLADLDGPTVSAEPQDTPEDADMSPPEADDFDALFADLEDTSDAGSKPATVDGLDDLLADFETPEPAQTDPQEPDDLDAMLADLDGGAAPTDSPPPQSPFGTISAARPEREALNRTKFRMALFGDFSGRAARGAIETGAALATRPAVVLDLDTLDEVIARFATTLTLPIGKNGSGVSLELSEIDDLHPDEIYDKLGIFAEIAGLRQQLGIGSMAEKATERLKQWSEAYRTPIRLPKRSGATSIPAHVKLSDFQSLIGDTSGRLSEPGPADDLIAQIVGPHIVKASDAGAAALADATDQALSTAMRLVLHHPDFQAVEAQWRSLDLLARRIETGSDLEIVLYDVSAEELAVDLAASEDLAESGFFRLLTDVLDPEDGAGGFSAVLGLYTFEETPTHAELLARIGQVAAHVDAPFVTAMTPAYLDVAKEDRHPLTAKSWDRLRARPEAAYLGLASPRFLLRRPYGARSEPIDAFTFEEFSHGEGLKGMLWANPAVLVAILLAATYKKDGAALDLGSVMSLGDIPFHYVMDRFGDQVALPCTERNLTTDPVQHTLGRGFMPVIWLKGRDEIRLGSFRALGGEEIAGPWSGEAPAPRKAPDTPAGDIEMELPVADPAAQAALDDLLAGFDDIETDDENDTGDDGDMDPELAALLEGL
ncbi:type VI secretion system contractile sheath domain-containing protein [Pseudosulfitobacter koreensis]